METEQGQKYRNGPVRIKDRNNPFTTYRVLKGATEVDPTRIIVEQRTLSQFDYTIDPTSPQLNKTSTLTRYTGTSTQVSIPSRTANTTITKIAANAFLGKPLTKLYIPETITYIDMNAFDSVNINTPFTVYVYGNEDKLESQLPIYPLIGKYNITLVRAKDVVLSGPDETDKIHSLTTGNIVVDKPSLYKDEIWIPVRGFYRENKQVFIQGFFQLVADNEALTSLNTTTVKQALALRNTRVYNGVELLAWGHNNQLFMPRDLAPSPEKTTLENILKKAVGVASMGDRTGLIHDNYKSKIAFKLFPEIKF
jgi:hypothetical protein